MVDKSPHVPWCKFCVREAGPGEFNNFVCQNQRPRNTESALHRRVKCHDLPKKIFIDNEILHLTLFSPSQSNFFAERKHSSQKLKNWKLIDNIVDEIMRMLG